MSTTHEGRTWTSFPELNRRQALQIAGAASAGMMLGGFGPQFATANFQQAATKRKSRAIVIGANHYDKASVLMNPVSDACRFTEWLIKKADVDPADIMLLTSPHPQPPAVMVDAGVQRGLADAATIIKTIVDFFPKADAKGERLYFYFSGHGVSFIPQGEDTPQNVSESDAIVPCDFQKSEIVIPIAINWILKYFKLSNYVEQFYFFDSCRNVQSLFDPYDSRNPPSLNPPPAAFTRQFILFATAPGRKTKDKTGLFTSKLLGALFNGEGTSGDFDEVKESYIVRWDKLGGYLKSWFDTHREVINLDENGNEVLLQPEMKVIPGDWGSEYPSLVVLTKPDIKARKLSVDVQPVDKRPGAKISIFSGLGKPRVQSIALPTDEAYTVSLPPGTYSLVVVTQTGQILSQPVPLYDDAEVKVLVMAPVFNDNPPPPPTVKTIFESQANGSGSIAVLSGSTLTQLELLNAAGLPVLNNQGEKCCGLGSMEVKKLDAGVYRIRAFNTDRVSERFVVLAADGTRAIRFDDPQKWNLAPGVSNMINKLPVALTDPEQESDGPHQPGNQAAESGPGAFIFQALRETEGHQESAALVGKNLGLERFPNGVTGVRIVLGVNLDSQEPNQSDVEKVKIFLGDLDQADDELRLLPPRPCQIDGVVTFTVPRPVGPYRLRIERPRGDEIERTNLASNVLPNRVSELIIEQSAAGKFRISQFAPEAHPTKPLAPEVVFKLHQLESDLQDGQPRRVPSLLAELKVAELVEPIFLTVSANVASYDTGWESLDAAASVLMRAFPRLPDGYVAKARALDVAQQPEAAKVAYRAALDRGLPVLSFFSRLLMDGIGRYAIEHPRVARLLEVTDRQIPGLIWTAWRPKKS